MGILDEKRGIVGESVIMVVVELEPVEAGKEVSQIVDEDSAPWDLI